MYGSVSLLSTWNCHSIVNRLYSNIKEKVSEKEKKIFKAKLKAEIIIVKLGNDHCDDFCFLMELRRPNLDQVSGDLGNEGLKGGGGWGWWFSGSGMGLDRTQSASEIRTHSHSCPLLSWNLTTTSFWPLEESRVGQHGQDMGHSVDCSLMLLHSAS